MVRVWVDPVPAGGAADVRVHVGHAEDLRQAGSRPWRHHRDDGRGVGEDLGRSDVSREKKKRKHAGARPMLLWCQVTCAARACAA